MQIERIRIRNFRAFRHVEMLDIPRLVVLVGANGTGKSSPSQCSASCGRP